MNCYKCGSLIPDGANFCENCGNKVETESHHLEARESESALARANSIQEKGESSPAVEYFSISTGRLFLFSVLTFNLYEIYWFARNWDAVKKATGKNIYPFWRAIFCVFFCYELFSRVFNSAKSEGYKKAYSAGWLATAYITLLVVGNAYSRSSAQIMGVDPGTYRLLFFVLIVLTPLPLLAVQGAINLHNSKTVRDYTPTTTFTAGEVVLIICGIIFMGLTVLGTLASISS